ncbi:hypothetical protein AA0481_2051 [Acetobacter orientalis NRIC 0481]|uniref:Uncharacterized protein n=1 Tax=Acetobacter orientalis TaxID=146474 RepID=A0A0D6NJZ8_9PROT|nr:hypothetical protein Abor_014_110 [Acetobacter orientalis]GBR20161.1 hypothetical protein AA0481_2051 [Acetobacter orientalis NRIC 0481]GEL60381.1 hypothetical protein AOR02nite_02230 [Acetobacter orientalis]
MPTYNNVDGEEATTIGNFSWQKELSAIMFFELSEKISTIQQLKIKELHCLYIGFNEKESFFSDEKK